MSNQKQLIVLIVITVALTSFLAGYLLTRPAQQTADVIQQQRGALIDRFSDVPGDATPTPLPPGLLQASTDMALAPTSASDTNAILYYHPNNGYVSKLELETRNNTLISTAQLTGLTNIIWSPDKNRVITVSRSSTGPVYKYFDYTSHANGLLGSNIKDAVFSPDSQRIATVVSAGGDSSIEITDFAGKYPKIILKTRLNNIHLFWPSDQGLAFMADDADTSTSNTQSLFLLTENGDLTQLVSGENGLSVRWSPDGSKFIYSTHDNDATGLNVFDLSKNQSRILPLQTLASTCAWTLDQNSIICAVENQGETSVIKLNMATNSTQTLFSNLIISPRDVFLSHLEDFLVIISAGDQSIWELKL